MENIILLIFCFLAGTVLKNTGRLSSETPRILNGFILHISLPALILLHIHSVKWEISSLIPMSMAWVQFGAGFLFFTVLSHILKLSVRSRICLILCGSLGNTSFLGIPMIEMHFGSYAVPVGILCDQPGTFLVLSLLGLPLVLSAETGLNIKHLIIKTLKFAPFQAFILAVLLYPVQYPEFLNSVLKRLGDTLVPLALFSVGFQFEMKSFGRKKDLIFYGLFFKLILSPFLFWIFYSVLLNMKSLYVQITVFESAMPAMITAGTLAMEHDLDPDLAASLVAYGIIISSFTLYFWKTVLIQ
ncbi:MAG TPA: AEC family transporter [Leptospiraceae bacterium]|nr:AEC family transporter [Leptospiraceae bacterium]HMY67999.1 AEC family transporter [Leptospiraceae bacterium]HMZ59669.1 AEC family transporter [Leptospiraceae bacterium]HNF27687.1 AEC family transporter [Leptospiraceae bacterium]HNI96476.1 AEC family transporter [Leptospiraceae bacterium]